MKGHSPQRRTLQSESLHRHGVWIQSLYQHGAQLLIVAAVVTGLSACSSDDSDPMPSGLETDAGSDSEADPGVVDAPTEETDNTLSEATATPTGDIDALAENALYLDDQSRCSIVGEDVSFSVRARGADGAIQPETDLLVSGFVTLVQTLGDSAELISRTDDEIVLQISRPDIVGITAETQTSSVTGYFSAIEADASAMVVQRKAVSGGCLYSLRTPGYCATVLSKSAESTIGRDGVFVSVNGCDLENSLDIPVHELPAFGL